MRKFILINYLFILLYFLNNAAYSIEKPVLRFGSNGEGNFRIIENSRELYPYSLSDRFYSSVNEKFCDFFSMFYRIDFNYENFNKYTYYIEDLRCFYLSNYINFNFMPDRHNLIQLGVKPVYYFQYGDRNLAIADSIKYKYSARNFIISANYSQQLNIKFNGLMYHNFNLASFWNFPGKDYMKFKSSLSVVLQHYLSGNACTSILKSTNFNFEFIIDFNKIELDKAFDIKDEDIDIQF